MSATRRDPPTQPARRTTAPALPTSPAPGSLITRRALVAGVGGLIAGAAAGAGAFNPNSTPARRPPSAGEELMTEHGVLKRILLAYRAAAAQLSTGHTPPAGAIRDAAQIIVDYVENFHEGLEEAYVFPRLVRAGQHADLVQTLLIQHDRGRHLTAAILATAGGDLRATQAKAALRTRLEQFVHMYEPHEAWEDTSIYPALRAVTAQPTLDDLAHRFAELENRQFGDAALTQILGRVAGVEQQLGIADLTAFTPTGEA